MADKPKESCSQIPWWVQSIILLVITGVISYKLLHTQVNLQFDFSSFLSLLLALFSVSLSAMFYFKATDTSNTFYDNTYKFTRDIAELLVRIESGFGERLRHLDEAYKGMQDRFDALPSKLNSSETKEDIEKEEKELKKILDEKNKLINDLVTKAKLRDEEKQQFLDALKEKEDALNNARQELELLKRRLRSATRRMEIFDDKRAPVGRSIPSNIINYVVRLLGPELIIKGPRSAIKRKFSQIKNKLDKMALIEMRYLNLVDSDLDLTEEGVEFLRNYVSDTRSI